MGLTIERRRLPAAAPLPDTLQAAHVAGSRAAFVHSDGRVEARDLNSDEPLWCVSRSGATFAQLSPSGRRILVAGPRALSCELFSVDDGALLATFSRIGRTPQTVNSSFIIDRSGSEILLVSRQDLVLEGFAAEDAAPVFRIETMSYYVADPVPMLDGDSIMALGHQLTENKDSFVRFSLSLCRDAPSTASRLAPEHIEPSDYAYRLAVGPCGREALVAFRNAKHHEVLEDGEVHDNPIYGFNGVYVRRLLDCAIVERISYDAPIETGAPLLGTPDAIFVVRDDQLDILERGARDAPALTLRVPDGRYVLDPSNGRVYQISANGEIDALTVRRAGQGQDSTGVIDED